MKILKTALVGLFAAMVCFAIAGCGGAGGQADPKAAFAGSWNLVSIEGEDAATAEDIELMKSLGLTVGLQLNEDGKGTFDLFGEAMEGTWTAESATAGKLSVSGQDINMTIGEDGNLSLVQGGDTMVFQKADAASSAAASSAAASSAAASSAEVSSAAAAVAEASSAPAADEAAASSAPASEATSSAAASSEAASSEAA